MLKHFQFQNQLNYTSSWSLIPTVFQSRLETEQDCRQHGIFEAGNSAEVIQTVIFVDVCFTRSRQFEVHFVVMLFQLLSGSQQIPTLRAHNATLRIIIQRRCFWNIWSEKHKDLFIQNENFYTSTSLRSDHIRSYESYTHFGTLPFVKPNLSNERQGKLTYWLKSVNGTGLI